MADLNASRIYGDLELNGTLLDSSGDAGTSGQVLSSTGTGTNEVKITASDADNNDQFGYSVAVGENKIVIGALGENLARGAVYVYDLDGTNEVKITASDGAAGDIFGACVAIGDNKIVVGAPDDNISAGAAYVYNLDGTGEVKITASDAADNDSFGTDVAIGHGKIAVGAPADDDNNALSSGSVYLYDLDGTNQVKITASDAAAGDFFGDAVAIGHGKLAVGAYFDDDNVTDSGSIYVYDLDGSNEIKINPSDPGNTDVVGTNVHIGSNKIVFGAYRNDDAGTDSGSVYVFDLDGSNEVKITASDAAAGDFFGRQIAIGDNKVIVGAEAKSGGGAVYVYNLDGTGEVKITASDAASGDQFGHDVAVGYNKIVCTADRDNLLDGAAYVYDLAGTNWITPGSGTPGIQNYIKCVASANTNLPTSTTRSTLSWMSTTPATGLNSGFAAPTASTITVPNTGVYLVGINFDLNFVTPANTRLNYGFEIAVGGTLTGHEFRNDYMRGNPNSSEHNDSSVNGSCILNLSANDTITVEVRNLNDPTNTVRLTTNSSIFVVQIV